jgi:hypothetical protein
VKRNQGAVTGGKPYKWILGQWQMVPQK